MKTRTALLILVLALPNVAPLQGQETPADTARVLLRVAGEALASGDEELAERLWQFIARRYPGTDQAILANRLIAGTTRRSNDGRLHMMTWSAVYGGWLAIALPNSFSSEPSESAYGAGLLTLPVAGLVIANSISSHTRVTRAQAAAQTFGSVFGTFQGIGWQQVLDIGRGSQEFCFQTSLGQQCDTFPTDSETAPWAAGVVGGLSGLIAGHLLARNLQPATVTAIGHAGTWGSWLGLAFGAGSGAEGDAPLTWSLLGSAAGAVAAGVASPSWQPTSGEVWLVTGVGIVGMVAGFGIDLLAEVDDEDTILLIPAVTTVVGLGAGLALVNSGRTASPPELQGSLVERGPHGWSFGLPVPRPMVVQSSRRGDARWVPAVAVSLADIGF